MENGNNGVNDLIAGISSTHTKIMNFKVEEATLEDVFINLTGKSLRE